MNNTANWAIIAGLGSAFFDIISQKLDPNKNSIDLIQSVKFGLTASAVGTVAGAVIDLTHENEWANSSNKKLKKIRVWKKGEKVLFKDPYKVRRDKYGNEIHFDEYGNRNSEKGWEDDHIKPKSLGGHPTHLNNRQPLQWRENVRKRDKYPYRKQA